MSVEEVNAAIDGKFKDNKGGHRVYAIGNGFLYMWCDKDRGIPRSEVASFLLDEYPEAEFVVHTGMVYSRNTLKRAGL
jgi:hypothetical protein